MDFYQAWLKRTKGVISLLAGDTVGLNKINLFFFLTVELFSEFVYLVSLLSGLL